MKFVVFLKSFKDTDQPHVKDCEAVEVEGNDLVQALKAAGIEHSSVWTWYDDAAKLEDDDV